MGIWDSVKGAFNNPVVQTGLGALTGGASTLGGQALGALGMGGGGNPLATLSGMQNPLASPPNPAAARGTPRAGTAPNVNNFMLGGDPNFMGNFNAGQAGIAQQGVNLNRNAENVGAQGIGLIGQGNAAANRGAPGTEYNPMLAGLQGGSQQAGQQQYGLAQQLQTLAGQQQGPSAAQAQLQAGNDAALQNQLSLARSGSGFGESSGAMQAAQGNAANIMAQNANQSGMLRAQEDAANRARQLQALGMSGEALGAGRAADLALGQQQIGQGQFGTQTALSQQQMNDALRQGLIGQGLQAQQIGLAGQAQGLGAQNQANQLALQAAQAQQQGLGDYERGLTDIYGLDIGAHRDTREQNQQNSMNWVNGLTGAVGAIGSIAAMSDRRAKKNVEYEDLSRTYRALGGK